MIRKEDVFRIGVINKPHGVKGEVSFTFTDDCFDRIDCPYLILLIDGIFVPFFIESYRFRSDDVALIKFERIDTERQARALSNIEVFFPKKYVEDDETIFSYTFFVGFHVYDKVHGYIGDIVDIEDSTINVLFVIKKEGEDEILLPAHEDFIDDIDKKQKIMEINIPDGLLN